MQKKWKEIWDAEAKFRKLKHKVENGKRQVHVTEFAAPLEVDDQIPVSRSSKLSKQNSQQASKNIFITDEVVDDPQLKRRNFTPLRSSMSSTHQIISKKK